MSHPDIDAQAVARLRQRLGTPPPDDQAPLVTDHPRPASPPGTAAKAKATARRVATPVVAKVRHELDRAASGEVAALRAEVAALRDDLERTRAEQAAALAALDERVRDPRPSS